MVQDEHLSWGRGQKADDGVVEFAAEFGDVADVVGVVGGQELEFVKDS